MNTKKGIERKERRGLIEPGWDFPEMKVTVQTSLCRRTGVAERPDGSVDRFERCVEAETRTREPQNRSDAKNVKHEEEKKPHSPAKNAGSFGLRTLGPGFGFGLVVHTWSLGQQRKIKQKEKTWR
jgi:hypothetical protein